MGTTPADQAETADADARLRILEAAFTTFVERGYAASTMLEIATRARVSKRDLYSQVGNKQEMLVACISARATRLRMPTDLAVPHDREALAATLTCAGARMLQEITDPTVIAMFRLAIAEAVHAPEVADALDSIGREAARAALRRIMAGAQACGLLVGNPAELAERFSALLWGNLMVSLLLGVGDRPTAREATSRARSAADALLALYPAASGSARRGTGSRP